MKKIWLLVILIISLSCKSDDQTKPNQDNIMMLPKNRTAS